MFSTMTARGGGDGLYCGDVEVLAELAGRRNESTGTERDMTEPKKATFASHLEERRGSRVIPADDKYLQKTN